MKKYRRISNRRRAEWQKRLRQWKEFNKWEESKLEKRSHSENLRQIGKLVDFYLKRHPNIEKPPNVIGIRKMHRAFEQAFGKKSRR